MEYLTENKLIKSINKESVNGKVNMDLMYILTPNEFFIYTFLYNQEDSYIPKYEKLIKMLNATSNSTVSNIVNKLKNYGLIRIEKLGQYYVWEILEPIIETTFVQEEALEIKHTTPTRDDRLLIEEQIAQLEKQLDFVDGEKITFNIR